MDCYSYNTDWWKWFGIILDLFLGSGGHLRHPAELGPQTVD